MWTMLPVKIARAAAVLRLGGTGNTLRTAATSGLTFASAAR
jgi:hypothetical protein